MAYNKTLWVDNVTDVNAANLNNLEAGVKTLDEELVTIAADIAGKAPVEHTHADFEVINEAIAGKAPTVHEHKDLADRIKAVEDRPVGGEVDLQPLTNRVEAIETALPGFAPVDHTHEGMGQVDLKPLTDRVVALETSLADVIARLVVVENAMAVGGEGHIHQELETKVAALESGKAEAVHQHNSSDIITSRTAK